MGIKVLATKIIYSDKLLQEAQKRTDIDFSADDWTVFDENRQQRTTFSFNNRFGVYKDKVKLWTLTRLDAQVSYRAQRDNLRHLANIFNDTRGFKNMDVSVIVGPIKSMQHTRASTFILFARFIQSFKEQVEQVQSYLSNDRRMRTIAEIDSWIRFDFIINDFVSTATREELRLFYPIIIWWKLCTVIPMRPEELCMIAKKPLSVINGKHFISIPTAKQLFDREPVYDDLPIDEELYKTILHYVEMTADEDRKFLFSEKYYRELRNYRRLYLEEVNVESFNNILSEFYAYICMKKMGYKIVPKGQGDLSDDFTIEKIQPGDLRPYAIYNMMSQGFDPYSIQRMARHRNISTQLLYYPNMQNMSLGKVHAMARRIRMRTEGTIYMHTKDTISGKSMLARQLMNNATGIPVKKGFCSNKLNCPPDTRCSFCSFYTPNDPSEYRREFEQEIRDLERCIDTMIAIYKEREGRYEGLKPASQELKSRIRRLAIMEAKYGWPKKEVW